MSYLLPTQQLATAYLLSTPLTRCTPPHLNIDLEETSVHVCLSPLCMQILRSLPAKHVVALLRVWGPPDRCLQKLVTFPLCPLFFIRAEVGPIYFRGESQSFGE